MLTLILKEQPSVPLEAENITPPAMAGLPLDAIRGLPVFLGKRRCRLDAFFTVDGTVDDEIEIHGDASKVKWLGHGMAGGRLRVVGNAGMHLGAAMKSGTIEVTGNASDWVGAEMTGGLIRIGGNAGGQIGAAYRGSPTGMKGGTILIGGGAGLEVGMRMRRGLIVVGGPARDFTGLQMKGGTIFLLSGAELRTGAWMARGTIVSLTSLPLLPTFAFASAYQPTFLGIYAKHLQSLGLACLPTRRRLPALFGRQRRCRQGRDFRLASQNGRFTHIDELLAHARFGARRRLLKRHHVDRHADTMPAAPKNDSFYGTDIVVVSAPRQGDVFIRGQLIVGRIDIGPANARTIEGQPGMRGVGANQAFLAVRWIGEQVAADVAHGQAKSTQATNLQVSEILANAAPVGQHLGKRRRDGGCLRIVLKFLVNAARQVENAFQKRPPRRKRRPRIIQQLRPDLDIAGIEDILIGVDSFGTMVGTHLRRGQVPGRHWHFGRGDRGGNLHRVVRRHRQLRMRLLNGEKERGIAEIVRIVQQHAWQGRYQDLRTPAGLARPAARLQVQEVVAEGHRLAVDVRRGMIDAVKHGRSYFGAGKLVSTTPVARCRDVCKWLRKWCVILSDSTGNSASKRTSKSSR